MTDNAAPPPLVAAIEAVLNTKVLSLRYLPSPSAVAAALGGRTPGRAEDTEAARPQRY